MFSFFKRKPNYPSFTALQSFQKKDAYFIRVAQWYWLNDEMITIIDPHNARMLTMDPWPQLVFLAANGQMTVQEYVHYMADKYSGTIPAELDKTILHELEKLENYRIIQFVNGQQRPESRFELPLKDRK